MFPYWGPVANASALNAYTKEDIKEVKARYLNILKANVRKNKLKLFSDNSDVSETCFKCLLLVSCSQDSFSSWPLASWFRSEMVLL